MREPAFTAFHDWRHRPCGECMKVCPLETKAGIELFAVKNRAPIGVKSPQQPADPYPPQ